MTKPKFYPWSESPPAKRAKRLPPDLAFCEHCGGLNRSLPGYWLRREQYAWECKAGCYECAACGETHAKDEHCELPFDNPVDEYQRLGNQLMRLDWIRRAEIVTAILAYRDELKAAMATEERSRIEPPVVPEPYFDDDLPF